MIIKDTNPKSKSGLSHMDILTAAPGIGNTWSGAKSIWEVFRPAIVGGYPWSYKDVPVAAKVTSLEVLMRLYCVTLE